MLFHTYFILLEVKIMSYLLIKSLPFEKKINLNQYFEENILKNNIFQNNILELKYFNNAKYE